MEKIKKKEHNSVSVGRTRHEAYRYWDFLGGDMKKLHILFGFFYFIVAMNLFSQDRSNEYNEFIYNWQQFARNNLLTIATVQSLKDANFTTENFKDSSTVTTEQIELLEKLLVDITKKLELASKDADELFDQNRRRLGNNFRFENKYLLEELSSSSPLMSLMDYLIKQGVTTEKYTLIGQLYFTVQYFLKSCRFLDQTDQYNFTTVILLSSATRELRTFRNLFR